MRQPPVALTIAGSDSGGGAGIQADLRTFTAHGVFGASVITALTAQNSLGVRGVSAVPGAFVAEQLDAVLDDLPVVAVKTGMLASPEVVDLLAVRELPGLVVDPVLVTTSGTSLFPRDGVGAYLRLFAHATVVTPNVDEAEALLGWPITTVDEAGEAARELARTGPRCVVITGGDRCWDSVGDGFATDVVWHDGRIDTLRAPRVRTANTHGTGCTLSAALAASLALGTPLSGALIHAKNYVNRALRGSAGWRLGEGRGPLSWKEIV